MSFDANDGVVNETEEAPKTKPSKPSDRRGKPPKKGKPSRSISIPKVDPKDPN